MEAAFLKNRNFKNRLIPFATRAQHFQELNFLTLQIIRMELVLKLPEDVVHSLLLDWNRLDDVVRLDQATCNRTLRPALLEILQALSRPLDSSACQVSSDVLSKSTLWALSKRIKLTSMLLLNDDKSCNMKRSSPSLVLISTSATGLDLTLATRKQLEQQWWCRLFCNLQSVVFPKKLHDPMIVCTALQLLPQLQHIDLSWNKFNPCWVDSFKQHGYRIESIGGLNMTHKDLSSTLLNVFETCPNLRTLTAIGKDWYTLPVQSREHNVFQLARHLHHVDLRAVMILGFNILEALSVLAPQLLSLRIYTNAIGGYAYMVNTTNAKVSNFLFACVNLRVLRLSCGTGTTDLIYERIAHTHTHLEELDLGYSEPYHVTDRALLALAAGCPKLRQLTLAGAAVTDAGLIALMTACTGLTHLTLKDCTKVTDRFLQAARHLLPYLRELHLIENTLSSTLRGNDVTIDICMHITMAGIREILRGCRHLRRLTVPPRLYGFTEARIQKSSVHHPALKLW